jgi:Tol biopolymer transport system component
MKKLLLLLMLSGQFIFAQQIHVQSIDRLKNTESSGLFHPVFSPSGEYLLATAENYAGLKLYSFSDKTIKTLTSDPGAGYGVQISADGNDIVYKKNEFVKNLKHTSLISYSRLNGRQTQLVSPTREPITTRFAANKAQYVVGKKLVRKNVTSVESTPLICIENQKIVLYNGSNRKVLTPNGENSSYIWPSVSPDKKNIAYTVAGKGTFVCRIDGSNAKSLGKLNAPVWLNNQWLVGMDDKDDGQRMISSSLVALTIDGKIRQTLSVPTEKMAMYPAASADGSRIAFNTENGEIYLMSIQIK